MVYLVRNEVTFNKKYSLGKTTFAKRISYWQNVKEIISKSSVKMIYKIKTASDDSLERKQLVPRCKTISFYDSNKHAL